MMKATRIAVLCFGVSWLSSPELGHAQSDLPPAKILRSLQFVQDSVVMGDHAAREMQKYLLSTMDTTLRTSDASIFADSKNADAALTYLMSGGNPATLDYLVARDVQGYFDSRVINVLQKYFTGRGQHVEKIVDDLIPEYRNSSLGPYLTLIAGNIAFNRDAAASLAFFDEARMMVPGTIVEEAALRRSILATMQAKQPEKALVYFRKYAVRFLHSPYASQFADYFVNFVVDNYGPVTQENITELTDLMDAERAEEIYLRIARQASLKGEVELARFATDGAASLLPQTGDVARATLSKLYSGLANVSGGEVQSASAELASIPSAELSPRDAALRDAAKAIAEQIMQAPSATPTQINSAQSDAATAAVADPASQQSVTPEPAQQGATSADAPMKDFFEQSRARLSEIDTLLKQEE